MEAVTLRDEQGRTWTLVERSFKADSQPGGPWIRVRCAETGEEYYGPSIRAARSMTPEDLADWVAAARRLEATERF